MLLFPSVLSFARFAGLFFGVLMRSAVLVRGAGSDAGTPGRLFVGGKFFCHSLELPWRGNRPDVSCIPAGEYVCRWHKSPRFGMVYQVLNVPGRSHILIHAGNWAGSRDAGLRSDVYGCLLLGQHVGLLVGQQAVLASRVAVQRLAAEFSQHDFKLIILDGAP